MIKKPNYFWGSLISGIGGAVQGGINYANQKKQQEMNMQMHRENLDWQKQAYQQSREDNANAMQTRVKDLENAGLNKALAMGGGGSSVATPPATAPFQGEAPQMTNPTQGFQGLDGIAQSLNEMITFKEDMEQKKAQTELMQAQVDSERVRTANISGDTKLKEQTEKKIQQEAKKTEKEAEIAGVEGKLWDTGLNIVEQVGGAAMEKFTNYMKKGKKKRR